MEKSPEEQQRIREYRDKLYNALVLCMHDQRRDVAVILPSVNDFISKHFKAEYCVLRNGFNIACCAPTPDKVLLVIDEPPIKKTDWNSWGSKLEWLRRDAGSVEWKVINESSKPEQIYTDTMVIPGQSYEYCARETLEPPGYVLRNGAISESKHVQVKVPYAIPFVQAVIDATALPLGPARLIAHLATPNCVQLAKDAIYRTFLTIPKSLYAYGVTANWSQYFHLYKRHIARVRLIAKDGGSEFMKHARLELRFVHVVIKTLTDGIEWTLEIEDKDWVQARVQNDTSFDVIGTRPSLEFISKLFERVEIELVGEKVWTDWWSSRGERRP